MVGMVSTTLSSNCCQVSPSTHLPRGPLGMLGAQVLCRFSESHARAHVLGLGLR